MFQLSEKQAQEIVDKMMMDIPYNINIMNDRGIIVGSGKKERVGTVHQGAVKALATGRMVEVWEDKRFEKKGTNEPIVIDGRRVGVIGISGNPDEVRPFCNIVRTTVALLIEQKTALENLAHEATRKKAFLETLLAAQGPYTQKLKKEAAAYKLDLLLKTAALYLKNLQWDEETSRLLRPYPSFLLEEDACLILVQHEADTEPLIRQLLKKQPEVLISVGQFASSIAESQRQAKSAMGVLLALKLPVRTVYYEQAPFLVKLSQVKLSDDLHAVGKLEDSAELLETLRSFINNNCSVSLTAAELNIHRNTLQYRLKRIETVTGKDPRNVLQLFELIHGLLSLYS
ncbi:MAG: sugar diacid recognition domain-containing protein [Paenibacillus macerans]|uniref:Sugar diacid recognition family protein n=1 Tax=Paenibacillus macerans TaxID=44252 RepID=A0A090Y848_PAEMA|nr:sugar diacid recognition domain-containing protein [Paenibacillus macerans]KFM94604.1 sugar diacid recognition family protein [Paenibacillus macerans]MBS5912924.1 helix-turn-helix domain-containing protein [Paenibacillus macerans]MCY7558420.1 helix-turn-helix domain-containing protein [Paenibacillus macerans]MDU7471734.1 sugar diacid recognition domain-containing protein [Paenibacillus macerans]MEC0140007.1 sugar diacid recognition domain-containing protein [Paenibacillus macerans]